MAVVLALVASLLFAVSPLAPAGDADAATSDGFVPGEIIADSVFFNADTMSVGAIQAFLDSKVRSCSSGYTCLKDYRQDTYTIPGTPMCSTYQGAANESAATIIHKVAQACGINPQSLLVMLQKEQGLVTSTAPTASRYRSAMGAGCPDTAPCDADYYGFFDQLHYGSFLLKRYTQPAGTGPGTAYGTRYDLRYPVGSTTNVQYHPNAGCGTKPVSIANQATHALYIYTPYTPNDAALRAGYGTGDGCSAYGNRNFYLYFTDWFGSVKGTDLVRTASDPTVYLVTAGGKHPVRSMELVDLLSPLGGVQVVPSSYVSSLPTRADATPLVRDAATGAIHYVGAGKRYRFTSCEQVSAFGEDCGRTTPLTTAQLERFADGGTMGPLVQSAGFPAVFLVEDGVRRAVPDVASLSAIQAALGTSTVNAIAPSVVGRIPEGPAVVGPARLMKVASSADVWVADGFDRKHRLTSFGASDDLGIPRAITTVSPQTLAAYTTAPELDRPLVHCGGDYFVGAGGRLWSSGTVGGYGLGSIELDASMCDLLPRAAGRTGAAAMAVTVQGSSTVFYVRDGRKRALATWNDYLAVAGETGNTIVGGMSASSLDRWTTARTVLAPGTLVKTPTSPDVYLADGASNLVWVRSLAAVTDLGLPGAIATVPDTTGYTRNGELTLPVVRCGGTVSVGDARRLAPSAAAHGLTATTLDPTTCAVPRPAPATSARLFVKSGGDSSVYYVTGGQKRRVTTWSGLVALAGSSDPRIVEWSPSVVSALPTGPDA